MIDILKNILHQLQKINYHTDDLYLYQSNNIMTKALLQIQIGKLMEYVEKQIKEYEMEQNDRAGPEK
jgi:hypothetical protein